MQNTYQSTEQDVKKRRKRIAAQIKTGPERTNEAYFAS